MNERSVDAATAADLIGTMARDVHGAVRCLVESALASAAPAQQKLGRIASGQIPADEELLREILGDLDGARQLLDVAVNALRTSLETRVTSAGGEA